MTTLSHNDPLRSLTTAAARLRLRITPDAERQIRAGHPWLYAESIREQNRPGRLGELAVIYDRSDRFLAAGLFDPDSPLRVRVLQAGKPRTIDDAWWGRRLEDALARRRGLFGEETTGYRWIHGESDGWPGLVLDRYDTTLVLKLYTAAWLPRLSELTRLVSETLKPERCVLRLSRNIQDKAAREFQVADGMALGGADAGRPGGTGAITFLESGLQFEADVLRGQKTGFFLDQRENRRAVEALSRGRAVLNAFSFSGGFSLYAARGGARSVTDLDISAHALVSARRNFKLNHGNPTIAECSHETVPSDAFEWLQSGKPRRFDLIVLDPPSLAKRESENPGALQAYSRLVRNALNRLARGGILVAASCSAHVSASDFFQTVRAAATQSGRKCIDLQTTRHPPDHPATFKEAEYLKCIYLRFVD